MVHSSGWVILGDPGSTRIESPHSLRGDLQPGLDRLRPARDLSLQGLTIKTIKRQSKAWASYFLEWRSLSRLK